MAPGLYDKPSYVREKAFWQLFKEIILKTDARWQLHGSLGVARLDWHAVVICVLLEPAWAHTFPDMFEAQAAIFGRWMENRPSTRARQVSG